MKYQHRTPAAARAAALAATLALGVLLGGCSEDAAPPAPGTDQAAVQEQAPAAVPPADTTAQVPAIDSAAEVREIEWDALIPEDYRPDKLLAEFAAEDLSDDDPRAAELMAKLKALWDQAPVREELDGAAVRLPGFVVPVEGDEKETTAFLLVPYYGACIHVPPPPANQTVYVLTEPGKGAPPGLFDVVWVNGTMSVKRIENDIAEAGYTLYASEVTPYE